MKIVDQIVHALEALGGTASYSELYAYIEKNTVGTLPKYWKDSIRGRMEENSSDSKAFTHKSDLFYSVRGLGNGVWGLRSMLYASPLPIDIEGLIDVDVIREGEPEPYKVETEVTRIIRDTLMTKQLKAIYHYKCQICDRAVQLHNNFYAEAHHLRPLGGIHRGTDEADNILVVCPNHHVEFDYGAIAIHPIEMSVVHIDPQYSLYGKVVLFHPLHKINDLNLAYHIDNVYQGM